MSCSPDFLVWTVSIVWSMLGLYLAERVSCLQGTVWTQGQGALLSNLRWFMAKTRAEAVKHFRGHSFMLNQARDHHINSEKAQSQA